MIEAESIFVFICLVLFSFFYGKYVPYMLYDLLQRLSEKKKKLPGKEKTFFCPVICHFSSAIFPGAVALHGGLSPLMTFFIALAAMTGNITKDREGGNHAGNIYIPAGIFTPYFPLEVITAMTAASILWMTPGNIPCLSLFSVFMVLISFPGLFTLTDPVMILSFAALLLLSLQMNYRTISREFSQLKLSLRKNLVRRKFYRSLGLFFPCVLLPLTGYRTLSAVLWTLTVVLWSAEVGKKHSSRTMKLVRMLQKPVMKRSEYKGTSGTTLYITGCAVASLFFGPAAPVSMIMTTLGDAWAVLVGSRVGKHTIVKEKSLEGSLACFLICVVSGFLFFQYYPVQTGGVFATLAGASAATVAELFSGKWDNLVMPVAASVTLWILL